MGKIFFPIITSLILINFCYSQPTLEWVRTYPDTNIFTANGRAISLDNSGNVYITGSADSSNKLSYCTVKYSASGIRLWATKFYGSGMGGRYAYAIALDKFSNVYITGYSYEPGSYFDFCTIKYNSDGVQQWVKFYNGPMNGIDQASKIAIDSAGYIYVSGYSDQVGGSYSYTTIKYSPDGEELWVKTYPLFSGLTELNGLKIDNASDIYITGSYGAKAVTIKYDSSGNQLWEQSYQGPTIGSRAEAKSLTLDRYNNVYIAGYGSWIYTPKAFLTIKYSYEGVEQWIRQYSISTSSDSWNIANSVLTDNIGNVYVSGFSYYDNYTPMTITTLKYSETGELLWAIKDTACIGAMSTYMDIDNENYIYVAGRKCTQPPYYDCILVIKYNTSGSEIWRLINSTAFPYCLKVDNKSNIYLTGRSVGRMCTIKYSQLVGIVNNDNPIPKQFKLYQNYPNPFNSTTKIKFSNPPQSPLLQRGEGGFITLKIFDILGREVTTLINQQLNPGTYEVEWDATNFPSGVYFYRIVIHSDKLITDTYSETRRMILIR